MSGDKFGGVGRPVEDILEEVSPSSSETEEEESLDYCRACKKETVWRQGKALDNTYWPRNAGRGQTISKTGPAVMRPVAKCQECGRSRTVPSEK